MTKHTAIKLGVVALVLFLLLMVSGCDPQARGFALPPGEVERGKATFVELGCNHCHSIDRQVEKLTNGDENIHFRLGGPTTRIKTYGDLVTSIINPSHRISGFQSSIVNTTAEGDSRMLIYNEVMTVQQLVDLTTYLETTYEVARPQYSPLYVP